MNTQNIKCTKASGFSLIELMVVIAIVAVLAAVAVPSYKNYIGKARMAEIQQLVGARLNEIGEKYSNGATMTATSATAAQIAGTNGTVNPLLNTISTGTSLGTAAVTVLYVAGTTPDASFTPAVTATYTGTDTNGVITWTCTVTGGTGGAALIKTFIPGCV